MHFPPERRALEAKLLYFPRGNEGSEQSECIFPRGNEGSEQSECIFTGGDDDGERSPGFLPQTTSHLDCPGQDSECKQKTCITGPWRP